MERKRVASTTANRSRLFGQSRARSCRRGSSLGLSFVGRRVSVAALAAASPKIGFHIWYDFGMRTTRAMYVLSSHSLSPYRRWLVVVRASCARGCIARTFTSTQDGFPPWVRSIGWRACWISSVREILVVTPCVASESFIQLVRTNRFHQEHHRILKSDWNDVFRHRRGCEFLIV